MFINRDFTFILDKDTKQPIDFTGTSKMKSKQLVEEYMLLANTLIGKYLFKYCKDKTLLRAHDEIKGEKRNKLELFL